MSTEEIARIARESDDPEEIQRAYDACKEIDKPEVYESGEILWMALQVFQAEGHDVKL